MSDHNYQDHWAHKDREDGRLSPAEVLGWVRGTVWEPERVHRVFFSHQFKRWLDRFGCVRFRHFRLFGEEGLARENITLWLYGETLTLEFNNTPLTQFHVSYQPDQKRFKEVDFLQRFETQYRSMQASLWGEEEVTWLKVLRLPAYLLRHRGAADTGGMLNVRMTNRQQLTPVVRYGCHPLLTACSNYGTFVPAL